MGGMEGGDVGGKGFAGRLAQNPWIAPIPGTTKLHHLEENIGADAVELTAEDLKRIEAALDRIHIQGERYTAAQQKPINR
ncbi:MULTISPECIES: hypothetical protein [unclassified Streptomyces]|uniref:hypothetical protein n=1 Tax=unclassified Streptomyces TaxID=2593676 RepID=UPI002DD9B3AB|nr:hypothetical protein [Streptomyces sp. NBC_01445]WSE10023.1 hypothetical protein OG574_45850 [Streptomyces sp. NBC_01445]